ncbi:MAG TPA: MFS transporter [Acidimicrobiales bacterium]|nr:MFS transporter [Acidimicrobiales bacterium]
MPLTAFSPQLDHGTWARRARHPTVVLVVILLAQLMVVLDTTIVNVALPHIQRGLGFSTTGLSWVINAYILTFGGLLLLGARAGDLAGRRRVFLAGVALFTLSSLAGGMAVDSSMLLATRALQGIGAAFAAPSALSLLTTRFPEGPARLRAIALYATVSAAGASIGLVAGGLLTELVSWRWVMFVNVPIGAAVWLVGRMALEETPTRHGRLDLIGAVTSTAGMGGIVLGLVEAGGAGWTDPVSLSAFALGVVMLALFVHNEARAEEPILPLRLFAHATRTTANVARGLVYAGFYGMFFFLSQYLQDVRGFSPVSAGLAFLPIPLSVFAGSQLTSRVLVKVVPEKALMLAGGLTVAVGMGLATMLQPHTSYGEILVWLVLLGAGSGVSMVSLMSASLTEVVPSDAGAASGLVNVSQQLGAAVGLAVLVTLFGALTRHGRVGPVQVLGYVHALDDVFALAAAFTVAAMVLVVAFVRTRRAVAHAPSGTEVLALESEEGRRALEGAVVLAEAG